MDAVAAAGTAWISWAPALGQPPTGGGARGWPGCRWWVPTWQLAMARLEGWEVLEYLRKTHWVTSSHNSLQASFDIRTCP